MIDRSRLPPAFILYRASRRKPLPQTQVEQSLQDCLSEIGDSRRIEIDKRPPACWPEALDHFNLTITFRSQEHWGSISDFDETAEIIVDLLLDSGWETLSPSTREIRFEETHLVTRPSGLSVGHVPESTLIAELPGSFA